MAKARTLPKQKRVYKAIYTLDGGLDYSKPTTMIGESNTPNCQDVWFRDGRLGKTWGSSVFADTLTSSLSGTFMLAKHYVKNSGSEKLVVHTDEDVYAYNSISGLFESILGAITLSGDIDDVFVSCVQNDFYLFSNGISSIWYWDMVAAAVVELDGGSGCRCIEIIGERVNVYGLANYPRRVGWTVVGGLSVPTPLATNWTDAGSGDTDLDSCFGDDIIQCSARLGNYVVIYGKKTIVMQEYAGTSADAPFNFYTRVSGIGTPSIRGVINLGDTHIILGWDDIYMYQGGTSVTSVGGNIKSELFDLINPEFISRCFITYVQKTQEVKVYYPGVGEELPNSCMIYNLGNQSWSKGLRNYTGSGNFINLIASTWDTIDTATTTWDEVVGRWDDVKRESLFPITLYGDASGVVYKDDELSLSLSVVAIDGYWESKDFLANEEYKRAVTNWMSLAFEAKGSSIELSYSTDSGTTWSTSTSFTLTDTWEEYTLDINMNAPTIRIRIQNNELTGSFEVRMLELGYVLASNRGV
jgi:hypothetical protein